MTTLKSIKCSLIANNEIKGSMVYPIDSSDIKDNVNGVRKRCLFLLKNYNQANRHFSYHQVGDISQALSEIVSDYLSQAVATNTKEISMRLKGSDETFSFRLTKIYR